MLTIIVALIWVFIAFVLGLIIGSKNRQEPVKKDKRRLLKIGDMKIADIPLSIPTTQLFCAPIAYDYAYESQMVPDEIWLSWAKTRKVRVWWYTDQEIPGR